MQEVMFNQPSLYAERRTGSEGPRHDPYGYKEFIVRRNGYNVKLHAGLACYIEINGNRYEGVRDNYDNHPFNKFEDLFGFSVDQLQNWYYKKLSRCSKCGSKKMDWMQGYPGESLLMCNNCKHINASTFCESVVI